MKKFYVGHGKAELRLASIATSYMPAFFNNDLAWCFNCKSAFEYDNKHFPEFCPACKEHNYCLPDILGLRFALPHIAIFVNGPHHDRIKRAAKDKRVYALLAAQDVNAFVIKPEEIDAMTNASLKIWLQGTLSAPRQKIYTGEKEYSAW